jgi:zinc D-Ala-D-Ala dipeptidase
MINLSVKTILLLALAAACLREKTNAGPAEGAASVQSAALPADTIKPVANKARGQKTTQKKKHTPAENGFSDLAVLAPSIILDIRYATTDNFTKAKIYDCPACLLRPEAARALVKAHENLQKKGFGLKMFDCYRPRPYQQRLWDKVPNPNYVTPPAKGSMHSRGAAVDLTLVDADGKELDMGTPFDFFGPEAHTDYTKHSKKVLENRKLLREALSAQGFKGIRTEWWHFSFQQKKYALSDYVWACE